MGKWLSIICKVREWVLTLYWGIETEGHLYKEQHQGCFKCELCGDRILSMAESKQTEEYLKRFLIQLSKTGIGK